MGVVGRVFLPETRISGKVIVRFGVSCGRGRCRSAVCFPHSCCTVFLSVHVRQICPIWKR
jgi:hypothetical protein